MPHSPTLLLVVAVSEVRFKLQHVGLRVRVSEQHRRALDCLFPRTAGSHHAQRDSFKHQHQCLVLLAVDSDTLCHGLALSERSVADTAATRFRPGLVPGLVFVFRPLNTERVARQFARLILAVTLGRHQNGVHVLEPELVIILDCWPHDTGCGQCFGQ